jgi:hypothetical protein
MTVEHGFGGLWRRSKPGLEKPRFGVLAVLRHVYDLGNQIFMTYQFGYPPLSVPFWRPTGRCPQDSTSMDREGSGQWVLVQAW